jgi:hypothetical protein
MRTSIFLVAIVVAAALAGCGGHPDDGAKQTRLQVEQHDANGGLQRSGRPEAPLIDPEKKSVVVLAAPSAPQLAARQQAQITAEHEKSESRIHDLMEGYTNNLRDTKNREKYREQIAQQLETYKRQSLQLYLMQRQADRAAAANQ